MNLNWTRSCAIFGWSVITSVGLLGLYELGYILL